MVNDIETDIEIKVKRSRGLNIFLFFFAATLSILSIAMWIILFEEKTLNISFLLFTLSIWSIYFFKNKKSIIIFVRTNYFKNLSNAMISAFLVFCILALTNFLFYKHPILFNLAKNKNNEISTRSKTILKSLPKTLKFIWFGFKKDLPVYQQIFQKYKFSKNNITFKFYNSNLRPDMLKKYNILDSQSLILEYNSKQEYVFHLDQQHVSDAILKLSRKKDPIIYYSIGHGELDLGERGEVGASRLKRLIVASRYQMQEVDLRQISKIPKNVSALIIWGPKDDFSKEELKILQDFLNRKSALMIAVDPQFNSDKIINLRMFMQNYNININNNLVIDKWKSAKGSKGMAPIISNFPEKHPITKDLKKISILFPIATSISVKKIDPTFITYTPLAESSIYPASYAETNFKELVKNNVHYTAGEDLKGPMSLAIAANFKKINRKIVAFGNSTFVSNRFKNIRYNFAFFLNSLAWSVEQKNLISNDIPLKREMPIFISNIILSIIFSLSIIVFPIFLLFMAYYFFKIKKSE